MSGQKADTPLLILAGGKGTRLREFEPNRPKPMVLVAGLPFLHWLITHYVKLGYSSFILSTGHMAEIIEDYPWSTHFPDCTFEYAREVTPLGTGGAVRDVFKNRPELEQVWVINGDTLLPAALPEVPEALEALYSTLERNEVYDATPNLHVSGNRVVSEGKGGQFFDGGAVFVTKQAISRYRGGTPCSLHELLGPAMSAGSVGYVTLFGTCYDIGTPERYRRFEEYVSKELKGTGHVAQ